MSNIVDFINSVLGKPVSPLPDVNPVSSFIDQIFNRKVTAKEQTPGATIQQPVEIKKTNTPEPSTTPAPPQNADPSTFPYTKQQYVNAVKEGFKNWFGEDNVPVTSEAESMYDEAIKYPIYYKYPFLVPAISFLETRGGRDLQPGNDSATPHKRYNATSWAIYVKPEDWTPGSLREVLQKTTSGIGERSPYYKDFRAKGDLLDIGNIYAPASDNPGTGGEIYAKHLREVMDVFDARAKEKQNE